MLFSRLSLVLQARDWTWALAAGLAAATLLVTMASGVVAHAVHYDELLHILSARGLLQTGQLAIADGVYTRAELFTDAVAWSLRNFGDSPVSARLPALAAGAALAFLVGFWVVRECGLLAGASAALVLCVVPATVGVAVFARFYTVHAVVVLVMFIAAYEAMRPHTAVGMRMLAVAVLAALIPLGWHFQDTTIIALGALVASLIVLLVLDKWTVASAIFRRRPAVSFGSLGLVLSVVFIAIGYGGLLERLGKSALWAAGNQSRYQYYLVEFRHDLPLLWPLFPLAVLIALVNPAHRRLAVFCTVAVGSALLVHSIAAQKSVRYIYYLVPLMCVLWGIGLANVVTAATSRDARRGVMGFVRSPVIALAVIAAVLLLSQEGARALNLVIGRDTNSANRPYASEPDWTPLVAELEPRARDADYIVTSNSMKAIYYLGRYDFELNATIVPETESRSEFGRDRRTGRQAIGTAVSIQQVLEQPGKSLVIIEESKIGRSSGVTTEAFSVIESHCAEISLPEGNGVRAWWCVAGP